MKAHAKWELEPGLRARDVGRGGEGWIVSALGLGTAECPDGDDFPMKEIYARVVANPALAGPVLLNLVRRADRSRYEDCRCSGLLTDEEYVLFEHIHAEHQRLARRLM